jgi:hypothetical protein
MIAILHDAIDCVEKYRVATDPQGQRIFQEAKEWLLADESEWPYSFECICGVLELDASAVRRRLRLAPEQQTSSRAAPKYREDGRRRSVENRRQATTDAGV